MSPRKKAEFRGTCPVCEWKGALLDDGSLYRHFGGIVADVWPDGICKGWGRQAMPGSKEPIR